METDLEALERYLGVRLSDRRLLERALVHRSYAYENDRSATNERLEFLGDAVLGLVITEIVYAQMPRAPEGDLAKLRAAAVSEESLAEIAREMGLGAFIRLGKGEIASGGADKDSILSDTFEAVLAAVHLDLGYSVVAGCIRRLFAERLRNLAGIGAALDYKTSLQELVAARYEGLPVYEHTGVGPDHDRVFTAEVYVAGELIGSGTGGSKKKAEQAAAQQAYHRLTGADEPTKEMERAGDA